VWLRPASDPAVARALHALPPALPTVDGGDADTLGVLGLVRAWASSDGALGTTVRRRLARAHALQASIEAGRHPTRAELRAWTFADDALQLGFPELLASATTDRPGALLDALRAHVGGLRELLALVGRTRDADAERALLLARVRAMHAGEKVIAFAQFAATIESLYRRTAALPGVAMLTSRGALTAGGVLGRRAALERFAPRAWGVPPPCAAERIDLLLATDLLSEGVNLQDASVVVHLDLPWSPALLAQRVGRVARLGSTHTRVHVYGLAPPEDAERWLRMATRLGMKSRMMDRLVGLPAPADVPPDLAFTADACAAADVADAADCAADPASDAGADTRSTPSVAAPVHAQALARTLSGWLARAPVDVRRAAGQEDATTCGIPDVEAIVSRGHESLDTCRGDGGVRDEASAEVRVAAVRAPFDGCLALVADGARCSLVAARDGPFTRDVAVVAACAAAAGGADAAVHRMPLRERLAALRAWCADAGAWADAGLDPAAERVASTRRPDAHALRRPSHDRDHRRVLARVAAIVRRTPPHRRPSVAALAERARAALALPAGVGRDLALAGLAASSLPDDAWLSAVAGLRAVAHADATSGRPGRPRPVALLLLQRTSR
jgi:hypothetical protein